MKSDDSESESSDFISDPSFHSCTRRETAKTHGFHLSCSFAAYTRYTMDASEDNNGGGHDKVRAEVQGNDSFTAIFPLKDLLEYLESSGGRPAPQEVIDVMKAAVVGMEKELKDYNVMEANAEKSKTVEKGTPRKVVNSTIVKLQFLK